MQVVYNSNDLTFFFFLKPFSCKTDSNKENNGLQFDQGYKHYINIHIMFADRQTTLKIVE